MTSPALWDTLAVVVIATLVGAIVARYFWNALRRRDQPGCDGGCCGGAKRSGPGGCS